MYKITWDKETGGVQLNFKVVEDSLSIPPRPVFWEELDLLKLNESGWSYPHCEEPLMWAINKQYFYFGELLFEAKGANMYDDATIVLAEGIKPSRLKAVNMNKMLDRNKEIMFLLESEAIEFIRDIYTSYASARKSVESCNANKIDFESLAKDLEKKTKKKMAIVKEDCDSFDIMPMDVAQKEGKKTYLTTKIDKFIASFSGGKDSQVVLDLCTRAIPSTDFEVVYSDTGYELPSSLELYEQVQDYYKRKFPDLKFSLTKNHESVLNYWDKIGTPSDSHRWCCSVMKTAPLYRSLKIEGTNKQAKVLTFDGVRAEESARRADYNRFGRGKHTTIHNAHPILLWNTVEIFLYIFRHNLPINIAYRVGKARVGCLICPFSTTWDDMIVKRLYPQELQPFTDRLIKWSGENGVKDFADYLKDRKWKIKAIGDRMSLTTEVLFPNSTTDFVAIVTNGKYEIFKWLPSLCDFTINLGNVITRGELKYKNAIYSYDIRYRKDINKYKFTVHNCFDIKFAYLLRRVVNKSAYCVQCEVCEVDCPTGALSIIPELKIDKTKCIQCHKCLEFHDKGCIACDSIRMVIDTEKKMTAKIHAYKTFGLREDWINEYFSNPEGFWENNVLGTAQVDGLKGWLKDAEITDTKNRITPFGKFLTSIHLDEKELTWELIIINLEFNSFIVNWFARNIEVGQIYDRANLIDLLSEQEPGTSKKTIQNAVAALIQMFNNSPIGKTMCFSIEMNKKYIRQQYENMSEIALAYSLYKFSEVTGIRSLRVSDFYSADCEYGPYKTFGLSKSNFEKSLRSLDSFSNRVLTAELNMGLDNITLRDDLNSITVLKTLL